MITGQNSNNVGRMVPDEENPPEEGAEIKLADKFGEELGKLGEERMDALPSSDKKTGVGTEQEEKEIESSVKLSPPRSEPQQVPPSCSHHPQAVVLQTNRADVYKSCPVGSPSRAAQV